MVREIFMGAAGVVVLAAVIAAIKYQMSKSENGEPIEQIFVDELTVGEIKKWFVGKIETEDHKGVVFYPTKENTEKWKVKMPENENMLIQIVYDVNMDKVVEYREIAFTELSNKVRELLDNNSGTLVIDK